MKLFEKDILAQRKSYFAIPHVIVFAPKTKVLTRARQSGTV